VARGTFAWTFDGPSLVIIPAERMVPEFVGAEEDSGEQ
jgi:hypothetical protein